MGKVESEYDADIEAGRDEKAEISEIDSSPGDGAQNEKSSKKSG